MEKYGDIKRANQPHLACCVLLNTQTPSKHTAHDTEDPHLRPVSLEMKRRSKGACDEKNVLQRSLSHVELTK
jgi:hypothetical protein